MVAFPELHKWRACGAPVRLCAWTPPPNPHRTPSPNPNTLTLTLILTRWEAVLVSPASERPPLLHALHVLTVQLLVVDLLAPSAVLPGSRFCATLLEALAAKLPHCPVNAYSWLRRQRELRASCSPASVRAERELGRPRLLEAAHRVGECTAGHQWHGTRTPVARALNQWHKHQAQCTAVQCTARDATHRLRHVRQWEEDRQRVRRPSLLTYLLTYSKIVVVK